MPLPIDASLRQFARAVTADRLAGDELFRAVLAELARTGQAEFAGRTDAFRLFIRKWRELVASEEAPAPFTDAALVSGMGPLPDEERLVLLLSDIAGFAPWEIERVLAPLSRPIDELLALGRASVGARPGAKAVILEDEPLIVADLRDLLEQMEIVVAGSARTADAGARLAAETAPDVILADFNLEGGKTGVDAILALQDKHVCPVIFITGYPDDVLKGEEDVEPDFVIVKPYTPEAVRAAVAHSLDTARYTVSE